MARNVSAPGRRSAQAARRAFNFRFMGDTVSELRRVTWPTGPETMRLAVMVIAISVTVGLLLGLTDLVFARMFDVLLGN